jgi:hypothetical protein
MSVEILAMYFFAALLMGDTPLRVFQVKFKQQLTIHVRYFERAVTTYRSSKADLYPTPTQNQSITGRCAISTASIAIRRHTGHGWAQSV